MRSWPSWQGAQWLTGRQAWNSLTGGVGQGLYSNPQVWDRENWEWCRLLKPQTQSPSHSPPPPRPHLLNLPKQFHQPGPSSEIYGASRDHCFSNQCSKPVNHLKKVSMLVFSPSQFVSKFENNYKQNRNEHKYNILLYCYERVIDLV